MANKDITNLALDALNLDIMKPYFNHKQLGGDIVTKMPQRKPDKAMTGKELLNKAVLGTSKPLNDEQKRNKEWSKLLKK